MKARKISSLLLALSLAISCMSMAVGADTSDEEVISASDYLKNVEHTPEIEKVTCIRRKNHKLSL